MAGGLDTYRDLFVLGTLDVRAAREVGRAPRRVHSGRGRGLRAPREPGGSASALGVPPLGEAFGRLTGASRTGTSYSARAVSGDGLAATIAQLVAVGRADRADTRGVLVDERREPLGEGVGRRFIRNRAAFDAGARHAPSGGLLRRHRRGRGPLMVGLAALGIGARLPRQPGAGYCSSDRGERRRARGERRRRAAAMAQTTFANSRGIAHKGSGGMSIVFPDVCKTPAPPSPIPIPYPEHRQVVRHVARADHGQDRRADADGEGREVLALVGRRGRARSAASCRSVEHERLRVHDVLVRREVRGEERVPAGRSAVAQQEEHHGVT